MVNRPGQRNKQSSIPPEDVPLDDTVAEIELDDSLDAELLVDAGGSEKSDAGASFSSSPNARPRGGPTVDPFGRSRSGVTVPPRGAIGSAEEDDFEDGYDPELGQTRLKVQGPGVMDAVRSDTGLVIIAGLFGLLGVAVGIYAGINHTRTNLIIGGIVTPVALGISIWRWREWLGRHPYLYRLLTTVGEHDDAKKVLDQHRAKQQQRVQKKMQKIRDRYGAED